MVAVEIVGHSGCCGRFGPANLHFGGGGDDGGDDDDGAASATGGGQLLMGLAAVCKQHAPVGPPANIITAGAQTMINAPTRMGFWLARPARR